jgi:hypothetical protein
MITPVTTLDQRYSDPDAVATEWDETRRVLESAEVFWISTVRADGRPHVTPCVAVWLDGAVYFDTGATQQKAINVSANPHVILTTGCNHWDTGLDDVVEGDAVRVTDDDVLKCLAEVTMTVISRHWRTGTCALTCGTAGPLPATDGQIRNESSPLRARPRGAQRGNAGTHGQSKRLTGCG